MCDKKAEWAIYGSEAPIEPTYSCLEHLQEMIAYDTVKIDIYAIPEREVCCYITDDEYRDLIREQNQRKNGGKMYDVMFEHMLASFLHIGPYDMDTIAALAQARHDMACRDCAKAGNDSEAQSTIVHDYACSFREMTEKEIEDLKRAVAALTAMHM